MRISDWSSDVCSSDLRVHADRIATFALFGIERIWIQRRQRAEGIERRAVRAECVIRAVEAETGQRAEHEARVVCAQRVVAESEPVEHAGAHAFHDAIGFRGEAAKQRASAVALENERTDSL